MSRVFYQGSIQEMAASGMAQGMGAMTQGIGAMTQQLGQLSAMSEQMSQLTKAVGQLVQVQSGAPPEEGGEASTEDCEPGEYCGANKSGLEYSQVRTLLTWLVPRWYIDFVMFVHQRTEI